MKSFEYKNNLQNRPIVYVDMDGVLADFFGAVSKAHQVKYWREIHRKNLAINQIAQTPGFFKRLRPLPNSGRLIRGVEDIAGKFSILSSPLLSDVEGSSEEKSEWLQHYLRNHQPNSIIFDHEKYKYAKQADDTPNILIDDYETNIQLWRANGGIGLLYKDKNVADTLKELDRALHGHDVEGPLDLAILKPGHRELNVDIDTGRRFTRRDVLRYIKSIHKDYHLEKPVLAHKIWVLRWVDLHDLKDPEFMHQDDPYRRVIDIDWEHVKNITLSDVYNKPIVVDENGWILDGNHRVTAARAANLLKIPALIPYNGKI
jgi:5'(3')-deoxyribonucleotidase